MCSAWPEPSSANCRKTTSSTRSASERPHAAHVGKADQSFAVGSHPVSFQDLVETWESTESAFQ